MCPSCAVHAQQSWYYCGKGTQFGGSSDTHTWLAQCTRCDNYSIWHKKQMIYPSGGSAPFPHPDLPAHIKEDYEEARAIVSRSPRSAAALLRLAIEKLTDTILRENKANNLDSKIELLVDEMGLRSEIRKAMHIVRVIGNNAVHPGQIDLRDNIEIAVKLFSLVNRIVQETITEPKEIDSIIGDLPDKERKKIEKGNGNVMPKGKQPEE
jgi:hypothetical protein